jgi:sterol desaturase/sphingolipid hydroxylase (fatty acid hydroxylase superfamily)
MELVREKLLFLISTPLYAFFIGGEMLLSFFHDKKFYSTKGTLMNVWLSALNFLLDIVLRGFVLVFLGYFYALRFVAIENPWIYWSSLLLIEDFMFYWLHRVDHYCRLFWAVHVTHHSSEEFNLTVGFRSSVFQPLYRFVWFIPLALFGFRAEDIMLMYAITQIYGILIHTQFVKRLGFLEWFLSTPSHHRVHHASNVKYLDKNMGMVLIIWDRMFGTFQAEEEQEPVRYGLTTNLAKPYHPFKTVLHEWIQIGRDVLKPVSMKARFMYVFGPPGWSHDGSTKTARQLREELKQAETQQRNTSA